MLVKLELVRFRGCISHEGKHKQPELAQSVFLGPSVTRGLLVGDRIG